MAAQIIAFPIDTAHRSKLERDNLSIYFARIRETFPQYSIKKAWGMARLALVIEATMDSLPALSSVDVCADEPWRMERPATKVVGQLEAPLGNTSADEPGAARSLRGSAQVMPMSRTAGGLPATPTAPEHEENQADRRASGASLGDLEARNLAGQIHALASGVLAPRNDRETQLQQLGVKLQKRLAELRTEHAEKCT